MNQICLKLYSNCHITQIFLGGIMLVSIGIKHGSSGKIIQTTQIVLSGKIFKFHFSFEFAYINLRRASL
jgi:hypothetical protein